MGLVQEGEAQHHKEIPEHGREIAAQRVRERVRRHRAFCPRLCKTARMARLYIGPGHLVQEEQGREVDKDADGRVEAFFCEPCLKDTGLLKKEGEVDGQDDPEAIDEDGKEVRDHKAGQCPAQFLFFCLHPMDKGGEQGGGRDQHELEAGAGGGQDEAEGVADVAQPGIPQEGDPPEEPDQPGSGR